MCVPKVSAQISRKIQKGIVRSQSFVNKSSTRIVGAIIQRSGNNVNPVVSVETPEKGYFELALNNIERIIEKSKPSTHSLLSTLT